MMSYILQAVIPLLGIGLLILVYHGVKYLRKRTDNETLKEALMVVEDAVYSVVCELKGQADTLRDGNGKLDELDAGKLKEKAMTRVNNMVSDQVKFALVRHISDMEKYISGKIEKTVDSVKQRVETQM
jgi:hypothetical protein